MLFTTCYIMCSKTNIYFSILLKKYAKLITLNSRLPITKIKSAIKVIYYLYICNLMGENYNITQENKKKLIQVFAKAATDPEYFEKLRADPKGTIREAGIQDEECEISVPDEKDIEEISSILNSVCDKRKINH
jgi:hypothetical protein